MKVSTFGKIAVSAGVAALLAGAITTPAQADPANSAFGTLVGLGSDTTQDVLNGLTTSINSTNAGLLASYDATGSSAVTTRPGGSSVQRASASGAGRDELRVAIGQTATASIAVAGVTGNVPVDPSIIGQIDFARSSGGPAALDTTSEGVLAYVPFARDAVDVAYKADSLLSQVPFSVGSVNDATTEPSLYRIYRGQVNYVYFNGTTYVSAGATDTVPSGATVAYKLQPLLPKAGSGTRSYFIGQIGLTEGTIPASVLSSSNGKDIEEHNGTAINEQTTTGTLAIAPFSISQWVAQANGVQGVLDRRQGVQLATLGTTNANRVAPTTGSGQAYATNASYAAMVRDVYNIVPSRLLDDPTSKTAQTFSGLTSLVCNDTSKPVITRYGFLLMPGTVGTASNSCGYTGLRAYGASASTTTLTVPTSSTAGDSSSVQATATVTSNNNAGGTVRFLNADDSIIASVALAKGATTVTATIPTTTAGTLAVRARFIPALSGINSSTTTAAAITVNAVETTPAPTPSTAPSTAPTTTPTTAPVATVTVTSKLAAKVTVSKIKNVKAGKTAKITIKVTTASKKTVTGTVTVKDGKKVVVKKAKLVKGKVTVSIKKVKKGTHKITVTYNGSTKYKVKSKTGLKLKAV